VFSTEVHRAIDASSHPELGQRLLAEDPRRALNQARCPRDERLEPVQVSVVYHVPDRELMVLVIPDGQRHREAAERAALWTAIAADTGSDLPDYVRSFRVVWGAAGLRALLVAEAERSIHKPTPAVIDNLPPRAASEPRLVARAATPKPTLVAAAEAPATVRFEKIAPEEVKAGSGDEELEVEPEPVDDSEVLVADQVIEDKGAPARRPVVTDGGTHIGGGGDVAIEKWIASRDEMLKVVDDDGRVRLALSQDGTRLEHLLGAKLGLKLQLHRLRPYPLVTLAVGPPETLRGERGGPPPHVFFFDIDDAADRAVLDRLARDFSFTLEIYDGEYLPVRKRQVSAALAENAAYVLAAAGEQLQGLEPRARSFAKALIAYDAPDYDRFGLHHPEHREFREDKLSQLGTPGEVRRALAIARRFSAPEREAYLVLVRGTSLRLWHARRRKVLERAIDVGLWPGPTLAQTAVSEGLARSRKDLIERVRANFARTCDAGGHDLDEGAVADNRSALDEQATAAGLPRLRTNDPAVVSGTIPGAQVAHNAEVAAAVAASERSADELLALLENKDRRLEAAVELARRGDERAIGPVFNTLRRMTRAEAVRVLGHAVGFGPRAAPHLIDGLRSRKAFLRHGCALSLAVLGTEEGVEAIADLLITEPTEIWREIARAVGEAGQKAVMPLLSRLAGQSAEVRERVSWALAHIAAQGGQHAVATLAGGRDTAAAAVAGRALELSGTARTEAAQVRGAAVDREMTVNRAFSRRFFEALEAIRPGSAPELADSVDLSGPAELLDEADLLEAADAEDIDAEPLDENDLIPT
jgi:HEAT repeat protein